MVEHKFTPGSWESSFTDCLGGPASYCRIRPVSGEMFGQFTSLEIATMNMMDEAEQQANARLIAAAPDLLSALELMLLCVDDEGDPDQTPFKQARAAITKALGGES